MDYPTACGLYKHRLLPVPEEPSLLRSVPALPWELSPALPARADRAAVAYFVSRQPLGPTWWPDHKMNICHQVIVEHHCISTNRGSMLICGAQELFACPRPKKFNFLTTSSCLLAKRSRSHFASSYFTHHHTNIPEKILSRKKHVEGVCVQ